MISKLSKAMLAIMLGTAINAQAIQTKFTAVLKSGEFRLGACCGAALMDSCKAKSVGRSFGRLAGWTTSAALLTASFRQEAKNRNLAFAYGTLAMLSILDLIEFGEWEHAGEKLQKCLGNCIKRIGDYVKGKPAQQ